MKRKHAFACAAFCCLSLLFAPAAQADSVSWGIAKPSLTLATGTGVYGVDLKDCTLTRTITPDGPQITFTPSLAMTQRFFQDSHPEQHTFSFKIDPIPLGGGVVGELTLTSLIGSNFGLAIGADGIELSATMSATATVVPSAELDIASGYVVPGGFDIFINAATISVTASLNAAGNAGGISFGTPVVSAPFSVSKCTGILVNGILATLPPFLPLYLPCDDIATALINANGGINEPAASGLHDALVAKSLLIIEDIEKGIKTWMNTPELAQLKLVPPKTAHDWEVIQGTIFTKPTCPVLNSNQPCLAFEVARKTAEPPTCKITTDTCDYGATFTCTGIDSTFGDKLQIYGQSTGQPWTLLSTQDGDTQGNATVHLEGFPPSGGPNRYETFSFWNDDPQNKDNSAFDIGAQNQTVALKGAWCHPSLCATFMVCKTPNGKPFMYNVKNPDLCAQKGGKLVPTTTCSKAS